MWSAHMNRLRGIYEEPLYTSASGRYRSGVWLPHRSDAIRHVDIRAAAISWLFTYRCVP